MLKLSTFQQEKVFFYNQYMYSEDVWMGKKVKNQENGSKNINAWTLVTQRTMTGSRLFLWHCIVD